MAEKLMFGGWIDVVKS